MPNLYCQSPTKYLRMNYGPLIVLFISEISNWHFCIPDKVSKMGDIFVGLKNDVFNHRFFSFEEKEEDIDMNMYQIVSGKHSLQMARFFFPYT